MKPDPNLYGAGPYPTTIMMHGCGKSDGPQGDYARAAARRGIASIIVNSYGPRRLSRAEAATLVCSGLRLWGRERAGDVLAALHYGRQQEWVDVARLSLAGWSHGGWSVMDCLALGKDVGPHAGITDLQDDGLDGVKGAFLVYPWCGTGAQTPRRGWVKPVTAFMLLGDRDSVSGVRLPLSALKSAEKSGAAVDSKVLINATHCFDEDDTFNPAFRYDPPEAHRAHDLYADWMAKLVSD